MAERKGHQQQETEGEMQFHSRLTLMEYTCGCLQLEGLYVGDLLMEYTCEPLQLEGLYVRDLFMEYTCGRLQLEGLYVRDLTVQAG